MEETSPMSVLPVSQLSLMRTLSSPAISRMAPLMTCVSSGSLRSGR